MNINMVLFVPEKFLQKFLFKKFHQLQVRMVFLAKFCQCLPILRKKRRNTRVILMISVFTGYKELFI